MRVRSLTHHNVVVVVVVVVPTYCHDDVLWWMLRSSSPIVAAAIFYTLHFRRAKRLWHTLNRKLVRGYVHDRDSRNLTASDISTIASDGDDIRAEHSTHAATTTSQRTV